MKSDRKGLPLLVLLVVALTWYLWWHLPSLKQNVNLLILGNKASPAYSTNKPSSINMIGYILFSNGSGG